MSVRSTGVIRLVSPYADPRAVERPVILAPPALLVALRPETRAGRLLLDALSRAEPGAFSVGPGGGLGAEAAETLTKRVREALPAAIEAVRRGEVRAVVAPAASDGKRVYTGLDRYVDVAGRRLPLLRYSLVNVVEPNIVMGRSYSDGGRYVYTDVVFINEDGSVNVRRLYGPHYIYNPEAALKAIIPADVLRAMREGRRVLRQGDIWLVELERAPRPRHATVTRSLMLFGSHRLRGHVVVRVGPGGRAEAVYVRDPVIEHPGHGRLEARGWYRVYWNKRYAPVVLRDGRVEALQRSTWD